MQSHLEGYFGIIQQARWSIEPKLWSSIIIPKIWVTMVCNEPFTWFHELQQWATSCQCWPSRQSWPCLRPRMTDFRSRLFRRPPQGMRGENLWRRVKASRGRVDWVMCRKREAVAAMKWMYTPITQKIIIYLEVGQHRRHISILY